MKKVFFYITLFLILLCFFVIYNQTDNYYCKYILILYLLPVSLLSKRPNIIYYVTLCVAAIVTVLSLIDKERNYSITSAIMTIALAISIVYLNAQKYGSRAQQLQQKFLEGMKQATGR